MTSRIVVFPVMGRRWAFSAVLPVSGGAQESNASSGGLARGARELFASVRASPRLSDQADLLTGFVSQKMNERFVAWETAPKDSIRQRLHSIGHRMLSRLGPTEGFLKAIPKDAELVEIVYPNCVNPRLVRRRVRHLAISGEIVHRRYMYGSIALLPFSAILGILPLPNVVLAWNLFRAFSHWRALQGSKRLSYLVTESPTGVAAPTESNSDHHRENSINTQSDFEEFGETKQAKHLILLPSEILDSLLVSDNVPTDAIKDVTVAEICKEYPLDPLEILKWRDHRLPIKSYG